ncbi:MaoC/PaaZ C-terminal domain-containing protein [Sphingobium sp. YR768]|uniref:MaoC/PaaZ C-terminal domain-containing protein n=1 Tax=Sphingobium sp. YR768 TaxID=1884365 RepID=UPI001C431D67|nr:MaoC/PaaZ C-terminal domain-containing protein [Sphingobium sp. YR768]
MRMDLARIERLEIPPIEQSYTARDAILYALGLGFGEHPLDAAELDYVYEKSLRIAPSFAAPVCHPGFWAQKPEFGIDWVRLLHAEQECQFHRSFPAEGTIRGEFTIAGVEDKGADKGALVHQEKRLFDAATGDLIATVRSTLFLRADGGQGGFGRTISPALALPEGEPSATLEFRTEPRLALIYRLSGDWNPLHADPAIARSAGFDRPILHGLCNYGAACRALLKVYCDYDPSRLKSLFVRFSQPFFPGETLRFEFFQDGNEIGFRALAKERGIVVLDRARARIAAP